MVSEERKILKKRKENKQEDNKQNWATWRKNGLDRHTHTDKYTYKRYVKW